MIDGVIVKGNPVNRVDPRGLTSCPDIRYYFIYKCIEEYGEALEKCKSKWEGETTQQCENNAKNGFKGCLKKAYNRCSEDLNGDGKVDAYDKMLWLMFRRLWDLRTPPFTAYPPGYGDEGPGAIDPNYYPIPPQT